MLLKEVDKTCERERDKPLGSFGINGPQFSELIRSHCFLGLYAIHQIEGSPIHRIAMSMPRPQAFLCFSFFTRIVGFGYGAVSVGSGSKLLNIHVGTKQVILVETRGGGRPTIEAQIEVVRDPEMDLGVGPAVVAGTQRV